jgi:PmbA protein
MELITIAKKVVDKAVKAGASQAEATVFYADNALTRFTKNMIHQNVSSKTYSINLDVVVGKNTLGSSTVSSIEEKELDLAVDRATQIAKVSSPDPDFKSFIKPKIFKPLPEAYSKKTAETSPEDRALAVKTIIETAVDYDKRVKWSAGSIETDIINYAVANSLGVEAETSRTGAIIEVNTKAGDDDVEGSGFATNYTHDISELDYVKIAKSTAEDAVESIKPQLLPIGEYEAIFMPEVFSTFAMFNGSLGFSARAHQDGYSFLKDKIGSQVFDEKLNIVDDGRSIETYNIQPFDGEGTPKKKLTLVKDGVPENICYDYYTALKDGAKTTGHAVPKLSRGFATRGAPMPQNQIVKPGKSKIDEMIEETKKGVYISRFHYVNPIRRDKAVISGLTRDACWYIENGQIKYPIKVMRFTDAIPKVLSKIDLIGNKSTVNKLSSVSAPVIKVAAFKFTGQSEF